MTGDILLTPEGDFQIENGDFVIGDATLQHQQDILISHKGEYKESPELGIGILTEVNNENPRAILAQIKRNFEYDGMTVKTLKVSDNGNLVIDAPYK